MERLAMNQKRNGERRPIIIFVQSDERKNQKGRGGWKGERVLVN